MEDRITLDREAFRTLASKTRVGILKSLGRRRKMLTELAKQFGMSPSTIKEHMDNLSRAGLVVQIDDGHKWKYYELTPRGREIVSPTGSRVFIVLGVSLFAAVLTAWDMLRSFAYHAAPLASRGGEFLAQNKDAIGEAVEEATPAVTDGASQAMWRAAPAMSYIHVAGIALFVAIAGISLGYIVAKRMRVPDMG